MTVPFRDAAELDAGGTAAYLRVTPGRSRSERLAGLLQINAKGEPVEFAFSTVQIPSGALWRAREAERGGLRSLTTSLFQTSQRTPLLVLCLAREIPPELFRDELEVLLPICRLAAEADVAELDRGEVAELAAEPAIHLFWRPGPPAPESPARRLLDSLARRGLLVEPFERIPAGLQEALAEETAR
jgi:hypothetical protein